MKGAEAVLKVLADGGVDVCFANPGTSEMQMVAAFDREPRVRGVLCLFEGVATGAADGYGRMAGRPAATLLHLGPGLANGLANLHNARRANTPIVNLVGEHATFHRHLDAPLTSDIEALAHTVSRWVGTARDAADSVRLAGEALAASMGPPGGSATLILPADATWTDCDPAPVVPISPPATRALDSARIDAVARAIRAAAQPAILLGSDACTEAALEVAGRLDAAGVRVFCDTFVARLPRGEGRFRPVRIPYFGEAAMPLLAGIDLLVTVHSKPPVAFFGYPDRSGTFLPETAAAQSLGEGDPAAMLAALAEALGAPRQFAGTALSFPEVPPKFNPHAIGAVIARHMPEDAVVSEDAATSGAPVMDQLGAARRHDWLYLTGGAIGQALPVALGAALAVPGRKVVALTGDGAAAYTPQALWSIAREGLDVTAIVFANHSYRILGIELDRTGSGEAGPAARRLLDLEGPRIDWAAMSQSLGVPAVRVTDISGFEAAFARAMAEPGPKLIEVALAG